MAEEQKHQSVVLKGFCLDRVVVFVLILWHFLWYILTSSLLHFLVSFKKDVSIGSRYFLFDFPRKDPLI